MQYQKLDGHTFSVLNDDGTLDHNVSVPNTMRRYATALETLSDLQIKVLIVNPEDFPDLPGNILAVQQDIEDIKTILTQAKQAGFDF